ncbi:HAD family phosphatase [Cryomorphaceae bacterium]|nr:HAD family phosphatase [Cryomorphaceae bacterium]
MIRNLILDLGGVLLEIDYRRTEEAFKKLGFDDFENRYSQLKQSETFDLFETGDLSADEFRDEIRNISGKDLSDDQINDAWNAMLLDLPQKHINLLDDMRDEYRLVLLSNTNEIHLDKIYEKFGHEYSEFEYIFERTYYSHLVGYRKPEIEIFEEIMEELGMEPSETLFIDDSPQHVEGAKEAGLNAYHLTPGSSILSLDRIIQKFQ